MGGVGWVHGWGRLGPWVGQGREVCGSNYVGLKLGYG